MQLAIQHFHIAHGFGNDSALAANQPFHSNCLCCLKVAVTDPHRLVGTGSEKAHVRVLVNVDTSLSNQSQGK
jgi:hypothetical protein